MNYTLVILDDVQKLTDHQRELIISTLYTMRPNLGVWIGERINALSDLEIVTSDATECREYRTVRLEEFYRAMKVGFSKVLTTIADRRVKLLNSDRIKTFDSCLHDAFNKKDFKSKLESYVAEITGVIRKDEYFGYKYIDIIDSINSNTGDVFECALKFAVLQIKYNRDCSNGQISLEPKKYTVDEFYEFFKYKDNAEVANYYLCMKCEMPYYYGKNKIIDISSHNIEQFLAFAGEIFANCISKSIVSKNKSKLALNAIEQHKAVKKIAAIRFDEITKRFSCGESIKNLISNLCQRSIRTRDEWKTHIVEGR